MYLARLISGLDATGADWVKVAIGGRLLGLREALECSPHGGHRKVLDEFLRALSNECWRDYDYRPEVAGRMLADEAAVKAADRGEGACRARS